MQRYVFLSSKPRRFEPGIKSDIFIHRPFCMHSHPLHTSPPDQLPLLASTAPTRFQYGIIPPTGLTHSPVAGRLQATFSYPISYNILLLNIYLLTFKGINVGCIFNKCNQIYYLFMTKSVHGPYIYFMIMFLSPTLQAICKFMTDN